MTKTTRYTVALCTDPRNLPALQLLNPSLILYNERDIINFCGDADCFIADTWPSETLSAHLAKIGVIDKQRHVVITAQHASLVTQLWRIQNELLEAKAESLIRR
ncbi:hypothetical protein ACRQ1B_06580 [Rhizobium panacihumi]|uniref:hypothetical protein n=1 Tax=Rhizobium panacihumi TaxID=2008450 RepID=UPI003D7AC20F